MPIDLTDEALRTLHPTARGPLRLLVSRAWMDLGVNLKVFDLWRDPVAQDAAFAAGRSKKRAGASWHNLTYPDGSPASFAAHVGIVIPGGMLGFGDSDLAPKGAHAVHCDIWDNKVGELLAPAQLLYTAVGLLAEEIGWRWGGRWSGLQDWCHVEWHPDGATMEQVKAALKANELIGGHHGELRA